MKIIIWCLLSSLILSCMIKWLLFVDLSIILLVIIILFGYVLGYLAVFYLLEVCKSLLRKYTVNPRGKAVFITGCDSGFGLLISQRLNSLGFYVFATVLNEESDGARKLQEYTTNMHIIKMDVTKDESVIEGAAMVRKKLFENGYQLWAIVNNAGVSIFKSLEFSSTADFNKVIGVNTLGILRVCQSFLPMIRERMNQEKASPRIVNITSVASEIVTPFIGCYNISKFGADALSQSLAGELMEFGIHVATVRPGIYKTAICANQSVNMQQETDLYGEKYMKDLINKMTNMFHKNANENFYEVVDTVQEAILTKYPLDFYYTNQSTRFWVDIIKACRPTYMRRLGI